jgi:polysaccharide chain length determinant protein (PEP-CTERM system associated)
VTLPAPVHRYVVAGWRHRWKALALTWLICLGGWFVVVTMPNQYQSTARLYADSDIVLGQLLRGIAVDQAPASQVDLLQRTLLSKPNLERVIARTDLDQRVDSVASRERLLKALASDIRITAQTRNLFTISFTDHDARVARDVVRALLDIFMESATRSDRQQMENARVFVAQQLAAYEAQLREAERRRAEFRSRNIDLLPVDGQPRVEGSRQKLIKLRGDLEDVRTRRGLLQTQLDATRPAPAAPAQPGAPAPAAVNPDVQRLADAERSLRELRLRYTDQHPDVVSTRRIIAELRAGGAGGGGGGGNGRAAAPGTPGSAASAAQTAAIHEQIKLRMLEIDGQVASLERQIREEEAEQQRLELSARSAIQLQAEMQNLDRDYEVLSKNYQELLERRESVQIAGAARSGADRMRLDVVDPPIAPTVPSGPNRLLFAAAVFAVALGAGAALALLLAQLDSSFYSLHDLRRIGLPVLGGVSSLTPPRPQTAAILVFGTGLALLAVVFGGVLARGDQIAARLPALIGALLS